MVTTQAKRERAAILLGEGWSRRAVAAEIGVDVATISRWRRDERFQQKERRTREAALDSKPSVRGVLEQALTATRPDGTPDHPTRLKAAALLLTTPPTDPSEPRVVRERIYVHRTADGQEFETREEIAA